MPDLSNYPQTPMLWELTAVQVSCVGLDVHDAGDSLSDHDVSSSIPLPHLEYSSGPYISYIQIVCKIYMVQELKPVKVLKMFLHSQQMKFKNTNNEWLMSSNKWYYFIFLIVLKINFCYPLFTTV